MDDGRVTGGDDGGAPSSVGRDGLAAVAIILVTVALIALVVANLV